MAWRYVVLFFSHFEIFFPLQCSITLTLFWDFFTKSILWWLLQNICVLQIWWNPRMNFPRDVIKKLCCFHTLPGFVYLLWFFLCTKIYMYFYFLEIIFNAHTLHFRNATIVIYAKFAAIRCFFPISFFFEKNSWNAKVNQFHEFFALNLIVKF